MPLYLGKNKNIIFMHIPKTGGSSVEKWLLSTQLFDQLLYNRFMLEDMEVTCQHLGIDTIKKIVGEALFARSYKFAIVRNPYFRLESEYFYRLKLNQIPFYGKKISEFFSFWVLDNLEKYRKSPNIMDNHLRPQCFFVDNNVEVFKFESGINNIVFQIAEKIKIPSPKLVAHEKRGDKQDVFWSQDAIEMVREIYAVDFSTFGYSQALPDSFPILTPKKLLVNKCQYKLKSFLSNF